MKGFKRARMAVVVMMIALFGLSGCGSSYERCYEKCVDNCEKIENVVQRMICTERCDSRCKAYRK